MYTETTEIISSISCSSMMRKFQQAYMDGEGRGEVEVCECVWAKTVRKDQVLPGAVCLLEEQLHPGLLEVPGSTGS